MKNHLHMGLIQRILKRCITRSAMLLWLDMSFASAIGLPLTCKRMKAF